MIKPKYLSSTNQLADLRSKPLGKFCLQFISSFVTNWICMMSMHQFKEECYVIRYCKEDFCVKRTIYIN